jgi:hypothetical protein
VERTKRLLESQGVNLDVVDVSLLFLFFFDSSSDIYIYIYMRRS